MSSEIEEAMNIIEEEKKKILRVKMKNQMEDTILLEECLHTLGHADHDQVDFYSVEYAELLGVSSVILPERDDEEECPIALRKIASYSSMRAALSDRAEMDMAKSDFCYGFLYRMPLWMADCVPREHGSGMPESANLDEYMTCMVSRNGIHTIKRTLLGIETNSYARYGYEFGKSKIADEVYYGVYYF